MLYALSAADFTILFVFVWLLARNIVKLVVERRRGLPFARFRSKLVALLLGMTLVPAVLVLIVGSELIRASVDRWFNAPMDEILASANQIAGDYYHERQVLVSDHAGRIARELAPVDLASGRRAADSRSAGARRDAAARADDRGVPRRPGDGSLPGLEPVVDVAAPSLPPGYTRAAADRLAAQALAGSAEARSIEALGRRAICCTPRPSSGRRTASRPASSSPPTTSRAIWRRGRGA